MIKLVNIAKKRLYMYSDYITLSDIREPRVFDFFLSLVKHIVSMNAIEKSPCVRYKSCHGRTCI